MFGQGIVARGLAFACLLGLGTGCAANRGQEAPGEERSSAGAVLLAPSLAGVDPRFLPELERVEGLISAGNHLAARGVLDALLARTGEDLTGRSLEVARAFERLLDLDPTYLPSLQALAQAVESGADREAAGILRRIELRQPRGQVLEIVRAYRRILDGRAVVASLRLRLECRLEPAEDLPADAPEGARFARLFLVGESDLQETVLLDPGPATLFVTRSVVSRSGVERDAVETRAFESLRRLDIGPEAPAEVSLARFFVSAAPGELASRIRFELDLRSGSARILPAEAGSAGGGREVPVMRLRVADAEETAFASEVRDLPAAAPEDLLALVSQSATVDRASALEIAVRIRPEDRERTLDLMTPRVEAATEDSVRALVPSLRWIAVTSEPGGGPAAWRAWLAERERKRAGGRPNLL
ncbi:MAG: hypothetical protein ACKVXR_14765, partial [Planctomycetota bacterium]